MKLLHDEKGQALVLTATSMLVLMGFLALATDVGVLFHARREMQTAADGAAVAGALEEQRGGTATEIVAAADNAAISNGYTNGSNGVTVTVHTPPTSGYHQTGGYIEVDISQSAIPTVLMGLFGQKNFTVATRAVAGLTAATKSCDNQLGGTGPDLTLRGSATINGIDCAINVASNSSDSVDTIGNGNTMNVAYIATEGGFSGSGTPQGTPTISGLAAGSVTDPFGTTVSSGEPALSACSQTISGNSYSGQLGVTTGTPTSTTVYCFSGTNVNIDGATLSNGVFVFEHGVQVTTGNSATISNGTLDLYGGVFQEPSNSTLNISAPRIPIGSDEEQWNNGIAFLVPTTNTTYTQTACSSNANAYTNELVVQFGNTSEIWTGYIYAPAATVSLHDQGGSTTAAGLVSASLCDLSSTLNITNYNVAYAADAPLTVVALVE